MGVLVLRDVMSGQVDTRGWYALQAGLAALLLLAFRRQYAELSPRRGARWSTAHAMTGLVAGLLTFGLWIVLTAPWMRLGEPATTFVPVDAEGRLQWQLIVVRTLGAGLVVPVMEELFWRGFLMRWIDQRDFASRDPRQSSLFAVLASSGVFALAHDLWLAGLLAGLIFAWLYRRTGQLWVAIVAHAVANITLATWVVSQRAWSFW